MPHKVPAAARLNALRHRINADPRKVAEAAGLTVNQYLELETTDKLQRTLTLYKLAKLARAIGMQPAELFTDHPPANTPPQSVFAPLLHAVRAELRRRGGSQSAFEAEIGWKLGDFCARPEAAWAWTVDGLRAVCTAVGLDWLATLPKTEQLDDHA